MNQLSQKQDAQFNQPAPPYPYHDDEISLIDLAKVMVKRRNWLFSAFIIGVLVTLLVAWLKRPQPVAENNKAFTTLLAVGYKSSRNFIEPLSGIETQLNNAFIPLASKNSPFTATVVMETRRNISEDGNNIIKIITHAKLEQALEVTNYHNEILAPLVVRHNIILSELTRRGNSQFESDDPLQPIATSIASLAQPLDVSNSDFKNRTSMIIALGLVLSAMLAVIAVFFREFASQVCASLRNDYK